MRRVTAADSQENNRLWLHFDDGIEGVMDLSDLPGSGVFEIRNDPSEFAKCGWAIGAR